MRAIKSNEKGLRTFTVSDDEWFDRMAFRQKAEEIIAWKLAESFTDEELQKLVKIDMKKVEKMVVERITERVVDMCIKSKAFKGGL